MLNNNHAQQLHDLHLELYFCKHIVNECKKSLSSQVLLTISRKFERTLYLDRTYNTAGITKKHTPQILQSLLEHSSIHWPSL